MASNKTNWWAWGVILAAIVAAFFFGKCNERKAWAKQTGVDTTVRRDTQYVKYKPVPYKVVVYDTVPGKNVPYPVYLHGNEVPVYIIEDVDSAAILKECLARYNATSYYKDTIPLKRGYAVVADTVSRNEIIGKGVDVYNADTTIRKTTILKQPKRFIGYVSFSGLGNPRTGTYGVGAGLEFKLKKDDRIIGAQAKYISGIGWIYEIKTSVPIRFFGKK